ncbi:HSP40/DnaJ peptide-binding protein [Terfezia boudieri ATCC MYA-4762]|uniref:HSP40/DnaJ peptide-binding protein n=1 Tax=Terfezia boudieri ATCC MYA-4762 TaxID=1051890 RepID=A0A3N4L7L8_9PEZI|nr:HSP40/DnaJ peptide-binding protein [Terfezia boudieri ATCC MYA-4762]
MSGTLNADKNRLYQVLEVTPDASDAEIKKAYNKLTMKWHNQNAHNSEAANTLKEIRHAYEVLTDPHKRQVYSQYGDDRQGRGGDWMSAEDVVSQLFSEMSDGMFSGRGIGGGKLCGRGLTQQVPKRSRDIVNRVKVPLEDIYKGKATKLTIQKNVICPKCEGRGAKEGAINKCTGCNGAREKTVMRQIGLVLQRVHISCSECNGKGGVVGNKDMCKHCNGSKVVTERKTLRFHVDKGVKDGTRIVFHGEGNQAPDIIPGDVVFVITTKPHLRFQRKDDDLFYYAEIDLLTALAGGRVGIQHLDRRWLSITIKPGEVISPGQVKAIIGQGMPSYRHHGNGNLYIHFNIKFPPNSFNDTEKLLALEHILPPRMPSGLPTEVLGMEMQMAE